MANNNNNDDDITEDAQSRQQRSLTQYITHQLEGSADRCPVIGVTGARRSGKTTIAQKVAVWAVSYGFNVVVRTTCARQALAWEEAVGIGTVNGGVCTFLGANAKRTLYIIDEMNAQDAALSWSIVSRAEGHNDAVLLTFSPTRGIVKRTDATVRVLVPGEVPHLDFVDESTMPEPQYGQ